MSGRAGQSGAAFDRAKNGPYKVWASHPESLVMAHVLTLAKAAEFATASRGEGKVAVEVWKGP
jgi:hypothetical protein